MMPKIVMTLIAAAVMAALTSSAGAAVLGPYTADANTLHLYHFNETSIASFADSGSGTAVSLTSNKGTAGVSAYSGFGTAFDIETGGVNPSSTNGGEYGRAGTSSAGAQSNWQGATGAFTYELLVRTSSRTSSTGQMLLCRDGRTYRGWQLQITNAGDLSFWNGGSSGFGAAIPTTGANAFVSDEWFHVAITYTGDPTAANNTTLYWTRVTNTATGANAISTGQLTADATTNSANLFGVGSMTRDPWRCQVLGQVDEVRISSVARTADQFIFGAVAAITGIPAPGTEDMGTVNESGLPLTLGLSVENTGDATSSLTLSGITGLGNGFALQSGNASATLVGDGVSASGSDIVNFMFSFDPAGKANGDYSADITIHSTAGDLSYTLTATVIPEPASTFLLLIGAVAAVAHRRRK
ncbi:MAG: LamG domain-containing protein [Planctomycetaceae bacterium]|nr:LamG domain-containing protein [Planctomycetaceae bacterium]